MSDIVIGQGDRLPVISRTISVNGTAVDLTGGTVAFTVYSPSTMGVVLSNAATITSAVGGVVQYSWTAGDTTALTAGTYFARFVATLGSRVLSAPNDGYLTLLVSGGGLGSFTYSGDPSTRSLDAVRFLIHDTDPADYWMTDGEITYILGQTAGSVYQAAHDACYVLAGQFARQADTTKTVGDLTLSRKYSQRSEEYLALAERFAELAARREPPSPWIKADALKVGVDRTTTTGTEFSVGQFDYRA